MINNSQPLSLAEVKHYMKDSTNEVMHAYLKEFCHIEFAEAKKLEEEIRAINSPKVREEHIVKIIDFLPKDAEEVNKIFADVSLTEQEANAFVEIVKKY
jgi:DNA-directed RNA polymerase subunit F